VSIPPLSVCVINFNGERYLAETIEAIRRTEADVGEILVVDSASTDASAELVGKLADVQLISLPDNRGPGPARNIGYRAAKHDLICFVDNDVAFEPTCPTRLTEELLSAGATFAMPRILYAGDPNTIQYDGAASHFMGLMAFQNANRPVGECPIDTREIQALITACFLADRSRWGAEDLFDEEFFYLREDHELGLRARILGHSVIAVPTARCLHRAGTPGLSLRLIGRYADLRVENLIRNRWALVLKNYEARSLFLFSPAFLLFEAFQFAGAIRKGWLLRWVAAFRWLVSRLGNIRRTRREVQRARSTPDRDILSGGPLPFADRLLAGRLESLAGGLLSRITESYWALARRAL
jgi:GT2 family glycosyltransferase